MTLVLFASLVILLVIGAPVYAAIGLSSVAALLLVGNYPLTIVAQRLYTASDSFALLAVPFFLLAGNLMDLTGISARIVGLASALVGWVRGGLSIVSVGACMFFAGVSGSAVADAAAIGSIVIPSMIKKGYRPEFAASLVATSGTIGPIIPPSVPFIIFGIIAGVSIAELFLAGIIPGMLVGFGLMGLAYSLSVRYGYPAEPRVTRHELLTSFRRAILALMMPMIILGGILGGIFTATESAVTAVLYAFVVGGLVYRELSWQKLYVAFLRTVDTTAVVMILIAASTIFSWVLTSERVPQNIASWITSVTTSKIVILSLVNVVFLFAGLALEIVPSMIMLVPIFLPIVTAVGIDPVHFGTIVVVNLAIGVVSPPAAPNLVITSAIAGVSLGRVSMAVLPFMAVEVLVLFIITYFPDLYMWLPLMYRR